MALLYKPYFWSHACHTDREGTVAGIQTLTHTGGPVYDSACIRVALWTVLHAMPGFTSLSMITVKSMAGENSANRGVFTVWH